MFPYRRKKKKIKSSKSNWLLCALFLGADLRSWKKKKRGEIPAEKVLCGLSSEPERRSLHGKGLHVVLWLRAPNHRSCDCCLFFFFNSYYFSPMILFSLFLMLCLGEGRQGTAPGLYCRGFLGIVAHNVTFK